jgi:hypothetical protein
MGERTGLYGVLVGKPRRETESTWKSPALMEGLILRRIFRK